LKAIANLGLRRLPMLPLGFETGPGKLYQLRVMAGRVETDGAFRRLG
jgi:hypothetical protein